MAIFNFESGKKHCSCSGRCTCQVEQILEQHSYLGSGILPISTSFAGCDFVKFAQNPSRKPIFATNFP